MNMNAKHIMFPILYLVFVCFMYSYKLVDLHQEKMYAENYKVMEVLRNEHRKTYWLRNLFKSMPFIGKLISPAPSFSLGADLDVDVSETLLWTRYRHELAKREYLKKLCSSSRGSCSQFTPLLFFDALQKHYFIAMAPCVLIPLFLLGKSRLQRHTPNINPNNQHQGLQEKQPKRQEANEEKAENVGRNKENQHIATKVNIDNAQNTGNKQTTEYGKTSSSGKCGSGSGRCGSDGGGSGRRGRDGDCDQHIIINNNNNNNNKRKDNEKTAKDVKATLDCDPFETRNEFSETVDEQRRRQKRYSTENEALPRRAVENLEKELLKGMRMVSLYKYEVDFPWYYRPLLFCNKRELLKQINEEHRVTINLPPHDDHTAICELKGNLRNVKKVYSIFREMMTADMIKSNKIKGLTQITRNCYNFPFENIQLIVGRKGAVINELENLHNITIKVERFTDGSKSLVWLYGTLERVENACLDIIGLEYDNGKAVIEDVKGTEIANGLWKIHKFSYKTFLTDEETAIVIGKKGSNIKGLRRKYEINFQQYNAGENKRLCVIQGSEERVLEFYEEIRRNFKQEKDPRELSHREITGEQRIKRNKGLTLADFF